MIILRMKKGVRLIIGWSLIVLGIISLPTPIPGILIIIFGLVILEERRILNKIKGLIKKIKKKY